MGKADLLSKRGKERTKEYTQAFNDLKEVRISEIKVNPYQPRKTFNDESIRELSESIKKEGLLQAIVITDNDILIAGERRKRACELLGLEYIKCVVRKNVSDDELERLAILENLQREDLSLIDLSKAILRLVERSSERKVAEMLGKSRGYIRDRVVVSKLDDESKKYVIEKSLGLKDAMKVVELGVASFEKTVKEVENKGGGFLKPTSKSIKSKVSIGKIETSNENKYIPSDAEKDLKNVYLNYGFEIYFDEKNLLIKVGKEKINANVILKALVDDYKE